MHNTHAVQSSKKKQKLQDNKYDVILMSCLSSASTRTLPQEGGNVQVGIGPAGG